MESQSAIQNEPSFQEIFSDTKRYNAKVREIIKNAWIIKVVLKEDCVGIYEHTTRPKYMLMRNELLLTGSPKYTLQGEDIWYLYGEYGKFGNGQSLDSDDYDMYTSRFHSSGRVIFSDWISDWVIYKTEEDISNIEDSSDRNMVMKLHRDIKKHNWVAINHMGI